MFGFFALIINLLCMFAAWIWTIVLGFKTSVMWGFLNMIPFVGFIWMIMHQEEAKGPAKLFIGGFVFMFINWKILGRAMRVERAIDRIEYSDADDSNGRATVSYDGDELITDDPDLNNGDEPEVSETAEAASESAESSPVDATGAADIPAPPAGQAVAQTNVPASAVDPAAGTVTAPLAGALRANSVYIEDAPIATIWTQYYAAVNHVQAGDPRGIREFEICLCADDAAWLRMNMTAMAELIVPGLYQSDPQEAQLTVLQTLLRNMPTTPPRGKPEVTQSKAVAVARLTTDTSAGPQAYTTVLTQEAGRWVLVQPFFVRTFVWTPQLAQYKYANGLPLSFEEQTYLRGGFAPFQQQIQGVYAAVGYKGL